jgi:hypothetical protein
MEASIKTSVVMAMGAAALAAGISRPAHADRTAG